MNKGWLPNYHGGWAMLALPPALGIRHGGFALAHLALLSAWLAAYFSFFAATLYFRHHFARQNLPAFITYAAITLATSAVLIALRPFVLYYSPLFLLLALIALHEARLHRERSLLSGINSVLFAAMIFPVACQIGISDNAPPLLPQYCYWITLLIFMYFAGTVWYVKSIIREKKSIQYAYYSTAWHMLAVIVAVAACWHNPQIRKIHILVCILLLLRAFFMARLVRQAKKISIKFVGVLEIAGSLLVFISLL